MLRVVKLRQRSRWTGYAGSITCPLLGLPWPRSRLEEQREGRVLVELGDALAFEAGLPLQRICEPGRQ